MAFEHTDQQPIDDVASGPDAGMCSGQFLPPDPSISMARQIAILLLENATLDTIQDLLDRLIEAPINQAMSDPEFSKLDNESQQEYLQELITAEFVVWRKTVYSTGRGIIIAQEELKGISVHVEAGDIVHDFFAKWNDVPDYYLLPEGALDVVFRKSIRNHLWDILKHENGKPNVRRCRVPYVESLHGSIHTDPPTPSECRETEMKVQFALDELPQIQRTIVMLRVTLDKPTPYEKIAGELGMGSKKVRSLFRKAKIFLQERLADLK